MMEMEEKMMMMLMMMIMASLSLRLFHTVSAAFCLLLLFVPKAHDCFTVLAIADDPRCARQAQLATTSKVNSWKSAAF